MNPKRKTHSKREINTSMTLKSKQDCSSHARTHARPPTYTHPHKHARTHIPDVLYEITIFWIDIGLSTIMTSESCKYWYFLCIKLRNMNFLSTILTFDNFLFDKGRSPYMTVLISKPTLIAVVLNICLLRVFHYKRISLQNKNACSTVSLSCWQNAQWPLALINIEADDRCVFAMFQRRRKIWQLLWSKYR